MLTKSRSANIRRCVYAKCSIIIRVAASPLNNAMTILYFFFFFIILFFYIFHVIKPSQRKLPVFLVSIQIRPDVEGMQEHALCNAPLGPREVWI